MAQISKTRTFLESARRDEQACIFGFYLYWPEIQKKKEDLIFSYLVDHTFPYITSPTFSEELQFLTGTNCR